MLDKFSIPCDAYKQKGGFIRAGTRMIPCDAYKTITNPETGRKVSINGKIGKKILNTYLSLLD